MSVLAKKIAGTYVADGPAPHERVTAWLQQELRAGSLSGAMREFIQAQPESLEQRVLRVTKVMANAVRGSVPCAVYDHESDHPFLTEVRFELEPVSGAVTRL